MELVSDLHEKMYYKCRKALKGSKEKYYVTYIKLYCILSKLGHIVLVFCSVHLVLQGRKSGDRGFDLIEVN